jgi:hypothetical protein
VNTAPNASSSGCCCHLTTTAQGVTFLHCCHWTITVQGATLPCCHRMTTAQGARLPSQQWRECCTLRCGHHVAALMGVSHPALWSFSCSSKGRLERKEERPTLTCSNSLHSFVHLPIIIPKRL